MENIMKLNFDDRSSSNNENNGQNMDNITNRGESNSNGPNLRRRRNNKIIVDENFDLSNFPSDISDSDTSEYKPSDSDSDVNKACMSVNTSKKRKLSKHNNKGKIISERESSDDDEYNPVAKCDNRDPKPFVSSPVSNDEANSTLELSSTVSPIAKCKLNTTVTPEKPKYTKKSRIKPLNKHKWWNENRKIKRNSGQAYEYKVKGNKNIIRKVEARKIGPPCKCKKKCFESLGQEAINTIFHDYWALGDYNLQTADLQTKIEKEDIKRRRPKKTEVTRTGSYKYYVHYNNVKYNVCRVAFLSIHDIKKDRAIYAFGKMSDSKTLIKDKRGTNPNPRKFTGPKIDCVHEHIQSLPVRSSHYTRNKNKYRQYVDFSDDKKYITDLWNLYRAWMATNYPTVEQVSDAYYNKVFSNNYNIASLPPRKDLCNVCFDTKMKLLEFKGQQDEIDKINNAYKPHVDKVNKVLDIVNACKPPEKKMVVTNPDFLAIVMDLQQTHPLPKLEIGMAYYKRKLNFHNFCVFNLQNDLGYMYVWTENTAKRGSVEIYSCLNKYLNDYVYNQSVYPKTLKIFADNCGGQNKNNNLCLALLRLVHQKKFDRIELIYLVPGHSYNACDREFGAIEIHYKNQAMMETPLRFIDEMVNYRKRRKPIVYHMQREDFLNIEIFASKKQESRLALIRAPENKAFQKACQIVISKDVPYGYILKSDYDISDAEGIEVDVHLPKKEKMDYDLSTIILPLKYSTEIKLNSQKIEDLKCLSQHIFGAPFKRWWSDFFSRQDELDNNDNNEENVVESEEPIEKNSEINNSDSDTDYERDRILELDEKVHRL